MVKFQTHWNASRERKERLHTLDVVGGQVVGGATHGGELACVGLDVVSPLVDGAEGHGVASALHWHVEGISS